MFQPILLNACRFLLPAGNAVNKNASSVRLPNNVMNEMQNPRKPDSVQDALVALMVATSLSDERGETSELITINDVVDNLPIFAGYEVNRIRKVSLYVMDLFGSEDGLSTLFSDIKDVLPADFSETAYALACDVVAGDGRLEQIELRFLQEIRHELNIDRLAAAAIERAAAARYRR